MKQDKDKISRKRVHVRYGICIICLIIVLILTNIFDLLSWSHTKQLNRYQENITRLKSPPNTYTVGSYADLGHIYYTNGDHCDYIAGVIFEPDLTKEEIIDFYTGVTLPSVDGKSKVEIDLSFYNKSSPRGRLVFQIQTIEGSLDSGLDIRCM